ncbi:hypothetical protein J2783_004410 [Chryseobacterium sediminis]|nr:hypothetical protein [Chryseobacterium sediminis]
MPTHLVLFLLHHIRWVHMTKVCTISLKYLYEYKIIKIIFERIEVFYTIKNTLNTLKKDKI